MTKRILFTILCIFMLSSNLANAEFFGTIEDISRIEGTIQIGNTKYRLDPGSIMVIYNEEDIGLAYIQEGLKVKFTIDAKGYVNKMELIGPQDKLNQLFNH